MAFSSMVAMPEAEDSVDDRPSKLTCLGVFGGATVPGDFKIPGDFRPLVCASSISITSSSSALIFS